MTKKQLPYCPAWTPTPTGDGGRFYCIQPEGHGGQHVSPTSNPGAVRHDLEWVIYGTSEGQEIVDLRASLAAEKARAEAAEADLTKARRERCAAEAALQAERAAHRATAIVLLDRNRLLRENAALRKVIEAAREVKNKFPDFGPGYSKHQALIKAIAELDAGEGK